MPIRVGGKDLEGFPIQEFSRTLEVSRHSGKFGLKANVGSHERVAVNEQGEFHGRTHRPVPECRTQDSGELVKHVRSKRDIPQYPWITLDIIGTRSLKIAVTPDCPAYPLSSPDSCHYGVTSFPTLTMVLVDLPSSAA